MADPSSLASFALLADGRFPSGGYAHSGGLEPAVTSGHFTSPDELVDFLRGRASTTGMMNAAFAVAAWRVTDDYIARAEHRDHAAGVAQSRDAGHGPDENGFRGALAELDAELCARTPSPALRDVGRTLGRLLVRSIGQISPHPLVACSPRDLQQPIAYGVVARSLDLDAKHTATGVLHEAISGPAVSAVKVLNASPFVAHAALFAMTAEIDSLAEVALAKGFGPVADLPALSSPLADIDAERHTEDDVRLFAS